MYRLLNLKLVFFSFIIFLKLFCFFCFLQLKINRLIIVFLVDIIVYGL